MELKPNCGSDRAWVYSVPADYADEEIRPELLAIKFANSESMFFFYITLVKGNRESCSNETCLFHCWQIGLATCDYLAVYMMYLQSVSRYGTMAVFEQVGTA
jgi:hypothetical protein